MSALHFILGCILGVILAGSLIAGAIMVLIATGSLWMMGALYFGGMLGFVLIGIGLASYLESR